MIDRFLTVPTKSGIKRSLRHCEEAQRADEAIQNIAAALDCFNSLAMTRKHATR
jgi:hypothetical protein